MLSQYKYLIVILLISVSINDSTQPFAECLPSRSNTIETVALNQSANELHHHHGCGYSSCPVTNLNKVNVHIIAHTHDDVGWLKTVDQYYYGTNKQVTPVGVQYILDSLIPQLLMDRSKRFVYVEMSFFVKWWDEQDEQMRAIVKQLVNEGRFEFINGGWCMNDEATVTYQSIIEQMTLGLRFLNETFGKCGHPKVGWQIDPFGHTNEQASLFAQFGFDGMFFTRIDYNDKFHRTLNQSLDIIWHADRALSGQSGSIFTNIFRDGYDAPNGFCFDSQCRDEPIVDNKKSYEYNIKQKGDYMINFIRDYAQAKLTNHVLIPFGGDFQFTAAEQNFKSLDKLIKYIRANAPDLHVFYSTPSCYQLGVHESIKQSGVKLPEKYDDFMPYASSPTVWWSGYFTSRPSIKLIERELADLLQVARQISLKNLLELIKRKGSSTMATTQQWLDELRAHELKCLTPLWEVLGDLQHHDAVTGTEKQHVTDDYVRRASDAMRLCAKFIGDLRRQTLDTMLKRNPSAKLDQLRESGKRFNLDPIYLEKTMFCPLLNISQCDAIESQIDSCRYLNCTQQIAKRPPSAQWPTNTKNDKPIVLKELETKGILVTAYNPLAKSANQMDFRLPCNGRCDLDKVQVISVATNETLKLIRLPVPAGLANLPFRAATTNYEILFYADLPPLGSASFVLSDENVDEIIDEESYLDDAILITDETSRSLNSGSISSSNSNNNNNNNVRSRLIRQEDKYEYFNMTITTNDDSEIVSRTQSERITRRNAESRQVTSPLPSQQDAQDRIIVKFDMSSGVIVGLKRVSDGHVLNITQKFGFYYPANVGHPPGAYIFRPNTSEPQLLDKPLSFKMYKRQNGALIEIYQKWADWIWQTIRVDARKNYIEFDYVVGPIPVQDRIHAVGREVVTRYITNLSNNGVFFTDSNGRQLMPRQKMPSDVVENLGGSFHPVVSTLMIKNIGTTSARANKSTTDSVAILVDRAQAGTSLNNGDLELLIHRRHLMDDNFGVGEALNEPGEDGRGLVSRGKHRLYLRFAEISELRTPKMTKNKNRVKLFEMPETPRANLTYELEKAAITKKQPIDTSLTQTYIVHDQMLNDIRQESIKYALKPVLTFDRLRVTAKEFMELLGNHDSLGSNSGKKHDHTSMLNTTVPPNIHLLTLQPWSGGGRQNQLLIRLENLDNPLTLHPLPSQKVYRNLLESYRATGTIQSNPDDLYQFERSLKTEVDIEHLIKGIRITRIEEFSLGANLRLSEQQRLDWTDEKRDDDENAQQVDDATTIVKLSPRQIRTFLATFVLVE